MPIDGERRGDLRLVVDGQGLPSWQLGHVGSGGSHLHLDSEVARRARRHLMEMSPLPNEHPASPIAWRNADPTRILHQRVRNGDLQLTAAARPSIGAAEVLVATTRSVVSAGTERAVRGLASASLVAKARARPDLVRQIVSKARANGAVEVLKGVRNRLEEQMPLGYSGVGTVVEVGAAAPRLVPGQRVATGGAGHAELQLVSALLAVPVPDEVDDDAAAFATIAAIALQGLRLAELQVGARVCVVGLGLVGQLTARLAQASGFEVVGVDINPWNVERAKASCLALVEEGDATTDAIVSWSRGRGVDAVLVTAATSSSGPLLRAPAIARDRATIVLVGDVGMELQRTPLYMKELTVKVARSYGPGRYDRSYEDWGVDYPVGHVRWTEGRNMEAVLDLMASGRLDVADLITQRFAFADAADAYALLEARTEPYLGIQLVYDGVADAPTSVEVRAPRRRLTRSAGVGLLGAGNYVQATMLPALADAGFKRLVSIASAGGGSARALADRHSFTRVVSSIDEMVADDDVDAIFIATPHSTHAELVCTALAGGKHVFCEKPLALTVEELDAVVAAWRASDAQLAVGFNRRFSPAVAAAQAALGTSGGPLTLSFRVNAGRLPDSHWYHDRTQGGRLLGEVCHFIDTCSALVGTAPVQVQALGSATGEVLLSEDVVVALRYPDGSLASIAYGAHGHPTMSKERLEVVGRGHAVVIDDFRSCTVDGKEAWKGHQDKGHAGLLRQFRLALADDAVDLATPGIETTIAALAAALSLLDGTPHTLPMPS